MTYDGKVASREPLMVLPGSAVPNPKEPRKREPAQWRPMTEAEQDLAIALSHCTYPPGTNQKRFARNLAAQAQQPEPQITDKQRAYLHKMVHRYRRQIPTAVLLRRLDDAESPDPTAAE